MDPSSALVDDFLTHKVMPPAPRSSGHCYGNHTPPSTPATGNNNNESVSSGVDTIKRVFQLQYRLSQLVAEAGECISELQQYNMFPRLNTASDNSNEEVVAVLAALLQQQQQQQQVSSGGGMTDVNRNSGNNGNRNLYTSNANANANANTVATGSGMTMWDTNNRSGNNNNNGNSSNSNKPDPFASFPANDTIRISNNDKNSSGPVLGDFEVENATMASTNSNKNGGNSNHKNVNSNAVTQANALASGRSIAFVEFKRSRFRKYVCLDPNIQPGAYVLVDGDRGTDCGLLVQIVNQLPDGQQSVVCMDGCDINDEKVKLENGRVIREATEEEVDRLHNTIASAEAVALKTCRLRCQELGIDIDLLDVEYQFDMKKIAFYFDCDHSVDFRSLVRELYRTFGARIWMENVNPRVKNSMPDGGSNHGHHGNNHRGGGGDYDDGNNGGYSRGGRGGRGGRRY